MGLTIGMGVTLLVLVLVAINIAVMRIGTKKGMARIAGHVSLDRIRRQAPMANYFGRTSQGLGQVRGNGVLVLTDTQLWFSRLLPRYDLAIPLDDITGVDLVRSHLGKTALFPLFRITYRADGAEDAVAWWVPHPQDWVSDLRRAMVMKANAIHTALEEE